MTGPTPPRWDDATLTLVMSALGWSTGDAPSYWREEAGAVLAALADAGLLVPAGGDKTELFATFRNERTARMAPWADHTDWMIRNSAEAALHTAHVWNGGRHSDRGAFAARCVQVLWPDGREYRTPWQPINATEEAPDVH